MVISSQIITIIIILSFQWSQECQCACNVKSLHTKGFSQNGFNGTPSKPAICTHGTPPTVTHFFQIRNNRINKFMLTDTIEKKKKTHTAQLWLHSVSVLFHSGSVMRGSKWYNCARYCQRWPRANLHEPRNEPFNHRKDNKVDKLS